MCGICGIANRDPRSAPDPAALREMCGTLVHRGPDDEGWTVRGPVGLAMRRLSIIDLDTGHQPLSNEDGTVWIVFNGEIYNFQDLRAELEGLGHVFATRSDTECIVHGYEQWGEGVCARLNGMFAFALWDERERSLLLARDPVGIKPLYWYRDDARFVFASELKALLKCPGLSRTVDPAALSRYLTFEYIPSPLSVFREVRKLEPGHRLTWRDGEVRVAPYWDARPRPRPWTEADAAERLRDLLRDSVRRQMVSDVPLGAFLSGGIDSSILVSLMAGLSDRPIRTFSIGFRESSYDELRYARAVAERYGTEHHEETIEPKALDLTERLVRHLDEPFGDFSIFPTFLVSRMARRHVTVALSGDGGDELFAGYDTYRAHRFDRRFYHWLPKAVKRGLLDPLARALPPSDRKKGARNSFKRFVAGTRLPKSLLHARWMVFLDPEDRPLLFSDGMREALAGDDPFDAVVRHAAGAGDVEDVARTAYADLKTYLADDILVKVDRMSMAVSLEARVPYLDHRIVEFALSLPPELKLRGLATKVLLKKAFWDDLPAAVQRRGKEGFSIPIKNWIRGELRPMMLDLLSAERLERQGFFRPDFVARRVREHLEGRENHSHLLWALMVFEQWLDTTGTG